MRFKPNYYRLTYLFCFFVFSGLLSSGCSDLKKDPREDLESTDPLLDSGIKEDGTTSYDGGLDGSDASANTDLANDLYQSIDGNSPDSSNGPDEPALSDEDKLRRLIAEASQEPDEDVRLENRNRLIFEIAYSRGFPITNGSNYTFVLISDEGEIGNVAVSGDFNGWSKTRNRMEYNPLLKLYVKTIAILETSPLNLYKFYFRDQFAADALAKRFGFDANGRYSLLYGHPAKSHIEWYPRFHASLLNNDRDLYVYLPTGYVGSLADYPVLYMHDGQNVFGQGGMNWQAQEVLDEMISSQQMSPIIVVGIPNTDGRMDEYTPVEDFLPDYFAYNVGGDAALYGDFVVNQVKPFIEQTYHVRTGRDQTGILGSSLGGLISFWFAKEYPQVFKYVGGMSSTFGWGRINLSNPTLIEDFDGLTFDFENQPITFYLDSGGGNNDPPCRDKNSNGILDDLGEDNYCENLQMRDLLISKGFTSEVNLKYFWAENALHNETAWHNRLPEVFSFFFPY